MLEQKALTTRVFATAWCCSLPRVCSRLAGALGSSVREDWRDGVFPSSAQLGTVSHRVVGAWCVSASHTARIAKAWRR